VKFLEVVKEFEESGSNSIKDFLEFTGEEDEEGEWNVDSGDSADAVRLMTVHKSKGLEYPVVVVLLPESGPKNLSTIVHTEGEEIELLHVASGDTKRSPQLERLYSERRLQGLTDQLNALYVVLTRARDELYVIAVTAGDNPKFPCSLLTPSSIPEGGLPGAKTKPGSAAVLILPSVHSLRRHVGPMREEKLGFDETQRGDAVHAVLAQMEYIKGDQGELLESAILRAGFSGAGRDEVKEVIGAFLAESGILEYFHPIQGRRVRNEQDFTSRSGDLFRADRVVIDDGGVTVIDYKTGGEQNEEKYRVQIRNYMAIAGEALGTRNVRGCIAYVDLKKLVFVDPGETAGGEIS
jgi:ATP-dependent exoDNAse (exonuclease V) beta subunit